MIALAERLSARDPIYVDECEHVYSLFIFEAKIVFPNRDVI